MEASNPQGPEQDPQAIITELQAQVAELKAEVESSKAKYDELEKQFKDFVADKAPELEEVKLKVPATEVHPPMELKPNAGRPERRIVLVVSPP